MQVMNPMSSSLRRSSMLSPVTIPPGFCRCRHTGRKRRYAKSLSAKVLLKYVTAPNQYLALKRMRLCQRPGGFAFRQLQFLDRFGRHARLNDADGGLQRDQTAFARFLSDGEDMALQDIAGRDG